MEPNPTPDETTDETTDGVTDETADEVSGKTTDETAADHACLADALLEHGLDLPTDQIEQLDAYRQLLWAWNEKLNLTRHTTFEKFVVRDLFDTIEIAKHLDEGLRVLDVGSGGGVPGLPLAILRPDLKVSVCESVTKKATVLQAMVTELRLRVPVHAARLEVVLESESFDKLIARAVAPLWKFLFWLKPHPKAFGQLLLIKGPSWISERGEARHRGLTKGFDLRRVVEYTTPRTDAVSTILSVAPHSPRPKRR